MLLPSLTHFFVVAEFEDQEREAQVAAMDVSIHSAFLDYMRCKLLTTSISLGT